MKQVYVAGPFRDRNSGPDGRYNFYQQERYIRSAEAVAWQFWRMGFSVICPHLNTAPFQGSLPDDVWLQGDLEQVRRSDFVVLAPGWEASSGTRNEMEFAYRHGIRVFEWDSDLLDARELLVNGVKRSNYISAEIGR